MHSIFVFGFAYGAFAAQILTQIVDNIGVLPDTYISSHPDEVWEIYQDMYRVAMSGKRDNEGEYQGTASSFRRIENLRDGYSEPRARVTFLGLFDATMPTTYIGVQLGYHTNWGQYHLLPSEISHPAYSIRHAVSMDEQDIALRPTLIGDPMFEGIQDVEQVWFLGNHAV